MARRRCYKTLPEVHQTHDALQMGRPHPIWNTVRDNIHDSRMAQLKCRLLTGTYNLQGNRAVFNQYKVNPQCKLCEEEPETRQHFLAVCSTFDAERGEFLSRTADILRSSSVDIDNPETLTRVILDPSWNIDNPTHLDSVERASRILIHQLHHKRIRLLTAIERRQGLGDCG